MLTSRPRALWASLCLYLGIALVALSPLLFRATTHTGGEWTTDYYHFHWNFWWIRHALSTPGLQIYETNYLFFPFTNNLAFHTLTLFWYPAWALLEPLLGGGRVGTLLAMDIIMVMASTLTGWTFYLLLRREGVSVALALPFGVILQVSSGMMLAAMLTTINYLSAFWLPLLLLIWGEVARARGRQRFLWALLLGLGFVGTLLTDFQHMLFLAFLLVPYGIWTVIRQSSWRQRLTLALAGIVALLLMTCVLWGIGTLPALLSYDFRGLSPQPIENAGGIAFPAGFFSRFDTYNRAITLGALVLPLVIIGIVVSLFTKRKQPPHTTILRAGKWFWFVLLMMPLVIALGAFITINGERVRAPYAWLHELFGGLFRSPARFDGVIIIAALLFAGKALTPLLTQRSPIMRLAVGGLLLWLAIGDAHLFTPMPTQPVTQDYTYYQTIGATTVDQTSDLAVVEVPVAGGSGEAWVGDFRPMEAQFYGMIHGKPMLNGALARAPLNHFWYWLTDDPMLAWLGQRRYLEPENVERQLRERINDWRIGWIVVHGDWIGREQPAVQEIIGYLNSLPDLLCPVAIEREVVFFQSSAVSQPCPARTPLPAPDGTLTIDIGAPDDRFFLGRGWHYAETIFDISLRWAGAEPQASLYIDLPPSAYQLEFSAQAFSETRTVRISVNGTAIDEPIAIWADSLSIYTVAVPADVIGTGDHVTVLLNYDAVVMPTNGDTRPLAMMIDWVRFTPVSFSPTQ